MEMTYQLSRTNVCISAIYSHHFFKIFIQFVFIVIKFIFICFEFIFLWWQRHRLRKTRRWGLYKNKVPKGVPVTHVFVSVVLQLLMLFQSWVIQWSASPDTIIYGNIIVCRLSRHAATLHGYESTMVIVGRSNRSVALLKHMNGGSMPGMGGGKSWKGVLHNVVERKKKYSSGHTRQAPIFLVEENASRIFSFPYTVSLFGGRNHPIPLNVTAQHFHQHFQHKNVTSSSSTEKVTDL